MNLQLHRVVSDITGKSGLRIIRSILAGERNPQQLASLKLICFLKVSKQIKGDRSLLRTTA